MAPKAFRLQARDVFVTYPKCDVAKERLEEHLRRVFKDFAQAAICAERHADGSPHLHAIVHLSKRCNIHSARTLDLPDGRGGVFHGNYCPARSAMASLDYVEKNGDVLYCGGDMETVRRELSSTGSNSASCESKKRKLGDAFGKLLEGASMAEILMDPELQTTVIHHMRNLSAAVSVCQTAMLLQNNSVFVTASGPAGSVSADIAEWLNQNLLKSRSLGQPQMYLFGPTGIGKTHLVQLLAPCLKIFYLNMTEDWMDGYSDDYDLVVVEEFHSQKTLQFMNQFLDGQPMPLRIRNSSYVKRKRVPVIITSNYSPEEVYPKVDFIRKASFLRRLKVIHATDRLDVTVLSRPRILPSVQPAAVLPEHPTALVAPVPVEAQAPPTPSNIRPEPGGQDGVGEPGPYRGRSRTIFVNEEDEEVQGSL